MKPQTKKIVNIAVTAIPVLMVTLSGIMKLAKAPLIVERMTKAGVDTYLPMLGIMEIIFASLFIFPKTMRMGFILLSCYFAGAIATELSHNGPMTNAMMILAFVWISAFIRDRSIFMLSSMKRKSAMEL